LALSASSFANGALGEHRRQDADGIRLEIDAAGCRSRVREIDAPDLTTGRAREREPRKSGSDCRADRRIEPERAPTGLARIPDRDDLLRIGDGLALGLGALGCFRCSALALLCSLGSATRSSRLSAAISLSLEDLRYASHHSLAWLARAIKQ
jgi:hypothetical protein